MCGRILLWRGAFSSRKDDGRPAGTGCTTGDARKTVEITEGAVPAPRTFVYVPAVHFLHGRTRNRYLSAGIFGSQLQNILQNTS